MKNSGRVRWIASWVLSLLNVVTISACTKPQKDADSSAKGFGSAAKVIPKTELLDLKGPFTFFQCFDVVKKASPNPGPFKVRIKGEVQSLTYTSNKYAVTGGKGKIKFTVLEDELKAKTQESFYESDSEYLDFFLENAVSNSLRVVVPLGKPGDMVEFNSIKYEAKVSFILTDPDSRGNDEDLLEIQGLLLLGQKAKPCTEGGEELASDRYMRLKFETSKQ